MVEAVRYDHPPEGVDAHADRLQHESLGAGRRAELVEERALVREVLDDAIGRVQDENFVLVVDGDLSARSAASAFVTVVSDGESAHGSGYVEWWGVSAVTESDCGRMTINGLGRQHNMVYKCV